MKKIDNDIRNINPYIHFSLPLKAFSSKDDVDGLSDRLIELVNEFYYKVSDYLNEENKNSVFDKLNELTINRHVFCLENRYDASLNELFLTENCGYINFMHQLFVVSSSSFDKDFQGFNHGDEELLINKYYEEFLEKKFFDIKPYQSDEFLVSIIEFISNKIIKDNNMLNYYVNGDYRKLLQDLVCYSSYDDTKKFLRDIDIISKYNMKEDTKISVRDEVKSKESIRNYLVKLYANKVLSSGIKFEREDFELYMLKKLADIPNLNLDFEEDKYHNKSNAMDYVIVSSLYEEDKNIIRKF